MLRRVFRPNDHGLGHVTRPVGLKGLEAGFKAGVVDKTAVATAGGDRVQTMPTAFDCTL